MKLSVTIQGEKALIRQLDQMGKQSERNRIARPAVREAASPIVKAAKANVPVETKLLKDSIGMRVLTKGGVVFAVVGPRRKRKAVVFRTDIKGNTYAAESNPSNYAHLVEFGTPHSPPQPFLRPAFDSVDSRGLMTRRIQHEIRKSAQSRSGGKADKTLVKALKKAGE